MANVEEKKNELDDKKIFTSNAQRTTTVAKGETIIELKDVTIRFNKNNLKVDNLKEYFIRLVTKQLMFQEFIALKDINLDISLKLEKILKFYGFNVIMTRTQDVMTCDDGLDSLRKRKISDIHNRFELMRKNPDAIFISVHQNKFEDSSQHGTQVFYSGNDERSKELAEAIQTSVTLTLQRKNDRVVKKSGSGIYLLYHAKIPAVLVECGFISNSDEVKKLKDESYRMKLAILIADGLLKYLSNH